jgi:anti-sigma factor RsiW
MTTHWIDRLSEYHDGELSPAEQTACESHLAACAECRSVLAEIRDVVAMARTDGEQLPAANLWPGILAKIDSGSADHLRQGYDGPPKLYEKAEAEPHNRSWGRVSARPRRQVTFSLPQLAMAATLLIAVSAAVAYVAAGRSTMPPVPVVFREAPIQAMAEPVGAPSADVTPANFADAAFDRAVTDLERTLVEQRDELDPRTIVIIERNLAVIDEAIRQARAALDADPANTFLNSHLADARRRKLELLRRATSIAGD